MYFSKNIFTLILCVFFLSIFTAASSVSVSIQPFGSFVRVTVIHSSSAGAAKTSAKSNLKKYAKKERITRFEIKTDEAHGAVKGGFKHVVEAVILEVKGVVSIDEIDITPGAKSIAFNANKFAILHDSGSISFLDIKKEIVSQIAIKENPVGIAFAAKKIAVLNQDGSVDFFNPTSKKLLKSVVSQSKGYEQGQIFTDGSQICTIGANGAMKILSAANFSVTTDTNVPFNINSVTFVGKNIYATTDGGIVKYNNRGEMLTIIATDEKVTKVISLKGKLFALAGSELLFIQKDAITKKKRLRGTAKDIVFGLGRFAIPNEGGSLELINPVKDDFFGDSVFVGSSEKTKVLFTSNRFIALVQDDNSLCIVNAKKKGISSEKLGDFTFSDNVVDMALGLKKIVVISENGKAYIVTQNK